MITFPSLLGYLGLGMVATAAQVSDTLQVFALVASILWFKGRFSDAILLLKLSDIALDYGFGRHIYLWGEGEGRKKARQWLKVLYAFELFFHTGTTLAKYSMSVLPYLQAISFSSRVADMLVGRV